MTTATARALPAIPSAFMPLIGTTSAFLGLVGVGLVMGVTTMVTAMM